MCGKNLKNLFWYCALFFFVVSISKSQQNFSSNEEKNDNLTVRYEIVADSMTNYDDEMETLLYDLYKKTTNNMQYEDMQYESRTTSTSNEDDDSIQFKLSTYSIQNHEDDKQISMEPRTNSTNANHKSNFTSHEIYGNLMSIEDKNDSTSHEFYENSSKDSNMSNIIPYEMCFNITCIQLCCPLGDRLVDNKCLFEGNKYFLPHVYGYMNDSLQSENKTVDELFQLVVYDPCQDEDRFYDHYLYDYIFFANGSLYLSYYEKFITSTSYCLAVVDEDKYEVTVCSESADNIFITTTDNDISSIEDDDMYDFDNDEDDVDDVDYHIINIIKLSSNIMSISLLVPIFLVYSILPELRNVHGLMLCNYSGTLSVAYTLDIVHFLIEADAVSYSICITVAFSWYYIYLVSYCWLNVMSFDMWRTFRVFSSLLRNIRQRGKRKLKFYAIFAWGVSFIFAIITVIMDSVSEYLPEIFRPKFREGNCWFADTKTYALYVHGPGSICIISSICLSISTALNITRYKKETGNRLTNSESRIYNDNKKRFKLYLKLYILYFIIMGISWSMTTLILSSETSDYQFNVYYVIYLIEPMQYLCFFIIFVWKKNIKRMILKRFGCGLFPEDRYATNAILLSTLTCTTTSGEICRKR